MRANAPTWLALDLRMMFQGHFERGFASTNTDVERFANLLGHAPRTYDSFATEMAKASEGVIAQDAIIRVALNPMEESVPIRLGHLQ
ncbi:MAG TPA: hypothetical protein VN737_12895 [Bryobacteraceae bacterium]|nr:hypothetical protein [Bryobacteraceae bacterium]